MAEILTVLRALDLTSVDVDASALLERIGARRPHRTRPCRMARRDARRLPIGIVGIAPSAAPRRRVPLATAIGGGDECCRERTVARRRDAGNGRQALLAAQREDAERDVDTPPRKAEFRKALDALELRGAARHGSGAEFGRPPKHSARAPRRPNVRADGRWQSIVCKPRVRDSVESVKRARAASSRAARDRHARIERVTIWKRRVRPSDWPRNRSEQCGRDGASARVARLEPVVARLAEADSALLEAEPLRALQLFEQVLRADGENTLAREGAARARSAIGSDRYAREIGQALEELRKGDGQRAREAYARAKNFRPDGIEIREGLIHVDALDARRDLDAVRRGAVALESNERWAEALATYESLVARDASLVFAREGAARARPRAELARRLDSLVNNAARLAAPEVRAEAESLIARATAIPGEAPRLRAQVVALRTQLQRYDTPVRARDSVRWRHTSHHSKIPRARSSDANGTRTQAGSVRPGRHARRLS
jgi:hypothetical protein